MGKTVDELRAAIDGLRTLNNATPGEWTYDSACECYDMVIENGGVRMEFMADEGTSKVSWSVHVNDNVISPETLKVGDAEAETLASAAKLAVHRAANFCIEMEKAFGGANLRARGEDE